MFITLKTKIVFKRRNSTKEKHVDIFRILNLNSDIIDQIMFSRLPSPSLNGWSFLKLREQSPEDFSF